MGVGRRAAGRARAMKEDERRWGTSCETDDDTSKIDIDIIGGPGYRENPPSFETM